MNSSKVLFPLNQDKITSENPMDGWNFEASDEIAPHSPWAIRWHRSFAGLASLQGRLTAIDPEEIHSIFGPLVSGIADFLEGSHDNNP